MPTPYRMISYVIGAIIVSSCAEVETRAAAQASEGLEEQVRQEVRLAERVSLGQPVIRAEVLTVQRGTTAERVKGKVHVTRQGEAMELERPLAIEQDDLLQLSEGSAVRLRRPDRTEFELTSGHGEWFRFDFSKE